MFVYLDSYSFLDACNSELFWYNKILLENGGPFQLRKWNRFFSRFGWHTRRNHRSFANRAHRAKVKWKKLRKIKKLSRIKGYQSTVCFVRVQENCPQFLLQFRQSSPCGFEGERRWRLRAVRGRVEAPVQRCPVQLEGRPSGESDASPSPKWVVSL